MTDFATQEDRTDVPLPILQSAVRQVWSDDDTAECPPLLPSAERDWMFRSVGLDEIDHAWLQATSDTAMVGLAELGAHVTEVMFVPYSKSPIETQVDQLKRLKDGWDGGNACAPSENALRDLESVVHLLVWCRASTVEVEDDGSVSLSWHNPEAERSFSLTFRGTGRVVGTLVSLADNANAAWRLSTGAELDFYDNIHVDEVEALLS